MIEQIAYNDVAGSNDYTIGATNSEVSGPVTNVKTDIVKNRWESTGSGDIYVSFDGTSANRIKKIFLLQLNNDTWTTIQAQASNDNFTTAPAATADFIIKTRPGNRYDEAQGKVVSDDRHDAYVDIDWTYNDYRIKLNSPAVPRYSIGRVYLAREVMNIEKPSDIMQPADFVTVSNSIIGGAGQNIVTPQYQYFNYSLNFKAISKQQADLFKMSIEVNPTCCYFIDDVTTGGLFFGNFTFSPRSMQGPVFNHEKAFMQGNFRESK